MARIHSRTRGKSGSSKPVEHDFSFVTLSKKDVEKKIVELAKEGKSKSLIGMILRDTYAVPNVKKYTGKSISEILTENNIISEIPEDLKFLVEKAKKLKKHLERHKKDTHNKRGLILLESKIRRLSNYYKSKGKLDKKWRFE